MLVHNPHTPCINITQCPCIKLPLEKLILALIVYPTNQCCMSQSSTIRSDQPRVAMSSSYSSSRSVNTTNLHHTNNWSIYVNRKAYPPRTYCISRLTHIKPPSRKRHLKRNIRSTKSTNHSLLYTSRSTLAGKHKLYYKSRVAHSHCISKNPIANSPCQYNTNNDPSIKFLILTSTNKDDSPIIKN